VLQFTNLTGDPFQQLAGGWHHRGCFDRVVPFVFGAPSFPLSDVPLQEIARDVAASKLRAKPARVLGFEEIREAHRVMEANEAGGKMAVVHG